VGGTATGWPPAVLRFFGECWYSDRRCDAAFWENGEPCVLLPEGVGGWLVVEDELGFGGVQWWKNSPGPEDCSEDAVCACCRGYRGCRLVWLVAELGMKSTVFRRDNEVEAPAGSDKEPRPWPVWVVVEG
jgi:hypothetical protein